ncbi:MAG: serine kinase [Rhodobacteraceae bacterium]|jgi:hypothetical protein|nr:serine kinase [Paracoccaceae bacterium]
MTAASAPARADAAAPLATCRAYGLAIASDLALPELAALGTPCPADLAIRRVPEVALPCEAVALPAWHRFGPDAALFRWAEVGAFAVAPDGSRIEAAPNPGTDDALAAFPLLGPVLAEALRRRGLLVLHAGAVEMGGQGIAVMADKGVGKSTAVAALLAAGARLLADDLAAVDPGAWSLLPGFGQLKLAPAALEAFPPQGATLRPSVHAAIGKTRVLVPGLMAPGPVPVRRLYVLERGPGPEAAVAAMPPDAALPALLRFAYAARFGRQAVEGAAGAVLFRQAVALAARGGVRRLAVPQGLDRLAGTLPDAVAGDLAGAGR